MYVYISKFLIPNSKQFWSQSQGQFQTLAWFLKHTYNLICRMHPNHPHVKCLELSVATTRRRQRVFRGQSHGTFQNTAMNNSSEVWIMRKFLTHNNMSNVPWICSANTFEIPFAAKSSCDSAITLDTGIEQFWCMSTHKLRSISYPVVQVKTFKKIPTTSKWTKQLTI